MRHTYLVYSFLPVRLVFEQNRETEGMEGRGPEVSEEKLPASYKTEVGGKPKKVEAALNRLEGVQSAIADSPEKIAERKKLWVDFGARLRDLGMFHGNIALIHQGHLKGDGGFETKESFQKIADGLADVITAAFDIRGVHSKVVKPLLKGIWAIGTPLNSLNIAYSDEADHRKHIWDEILENNLPFQYLFRPHVEHLIGGENDKQDVRVQQQPSVSSVPMSLREKEPSEMICLPGAEESVGDQQKEKQEIVTATEKIKPQKGRKKPRRKKIRGIKV